MAETQATGTGDEVRPSTLDRQAGGRMVGQVHPGKEETWAREETRHSRPREGWRKDYN